MDDVHFPQFLCIDEKFQNEGIFGGKGWLDGPAYGSCIQKGICRRKRCRII